MPVAGGRLRPASCPMLHGRLLRYLDEVSRAGSIRKASSRLNVAASAINRQLIELETELGTPIFEHMPRGLRLTAAGEILIAHIRETLREHGRAVARVAELKGLMRGEVTIATMTGLASGMLGDALAGFRAAHPRVKLVVRLLTREAIVQAVLSGEADLGLAYNLPGDPRLSRAAEYEHRIGAVVAAEHPLAWRTSVRFSDCLEYPLVVAEHGLSLRDVIDLVIPPTVEFTPVMETNSLELMKYFARRPPHVTVLNAADVYPEVRDGSLVFVPIIGSIARQRISLVQRTKGTSNPAAATVARFVDVAFKARQP